MIGALRGGQPTGTVLPDEGCKNRIATEQDTTGA